MTDALLDVERLETAFFTDEGILKAVDGVSFQLRAGETLGIVGESGSGKSVTSLSIIDLLPKPSGQIVGGSIRLHGQELRGISDAELHKIRGNRISMIFQEPMTALNPVRSIGTQLAEIYDIHFPKLSRSEVYHRSVTLLSEVGIPEPEQRLSEYPHQLSGGMRQRVMIAMALACEPEVLIADEPTTALDVTIQAQILDLMQRLQREHGTAIIFITHDLGVIAELADRVLVMYGGRVAEHGTADEIFYFPRHPYTQGLLRAIPRLQGKAKTRLPIIEGMVPTLKQMPAGCRFENRCPYAEERCRQASPPLELLENHHQIACFRWRELLDRKSNEPT